MAKNGSGANGGIAVDKQKPKKKKSNPIWTLILVAVCVAVLVGGEFFFRRSAQSGESFPELEGTPEVGQWYTITPESAKSADGSAWHGLIRKGTENKVFVYFNGGGLSLSGETSQQNGEVYFLSTVSYQDNITAAGILSDDERNPFRDWTFLVLEYSTGDCHVGTAEYRYTDESGTEHTVYHNGYNNYAAFLDKALPYIGSPDSLVVAGSSAGGFAAALLTDDLMDRIPSAANVTTCVDSSLLLTENWQSIARDLWGAPEAIWQPLTSDNIVLDSLSALRQKRGDAVKLLFTSSLRDHDMQRYQSYLRTGDLTGSLEIGQQFQQDLTDMVRAMEEQLPGSGVYIWEYGVSEKDSSTQHMILPINPFDDLSGGKSVADWLSDAVNGTVASYGLDLLGG